MPEQAAQNIEAVRQLYDALNRNDIPAMARLLDPDVEWVEPDHYPRGGAHRGKEAVTTHLAVSRDTWAEGACEPVRFFAKGDKVVAFVDVHVLVKGHTEWVQAQLADVFTLREGLVVQVTHFPERQDALAWAGVTETP